jgi:hypothetical protein
MARLRRARIWARVKNGISGVDADCWYRIGESGAAHKLVVEV